MTRPRDATRRVTPRRASASRVGSRWSRWAAGAIPPAADGEYYHRLATRIASGQGYTWLWPDGVVTYAAHYPVGYPALHRAAYALFGGSRSSRCSSTR